MGVRESLEKNKKWLVPVIVAMTIPLVVIITRNFTSNSTPPDAIEQLYFSDDDGKTFFADSVSRLTPFDHNGKQAYRAYVYTCDGTGPQFVGLLGREIKADASSAAKGYSRSERTGLMEVKKPGTNDWVPFNSPEADKMIKGLCSKGRAIAVLPGVTD